MWVWGLAAAFADTTCPWGPSVETASATMTTVTVDGQVFEVLGPAARARFLATLRDCGASPEAIAAFKAWRAMRQTTNITAAAGFAPPLWPVWFAVPITASTAGHRRSELVAALLAR